jgi:hypothetical protein
VILFTEWIFADVSRLWPCFARSLDVISDWNIQLNCSCSKELMNRNIKFIVLINRNDQKRFKSSVHENQHFFFVSLLIGVGNLFEMRIAGSDCILL